MRRNDCVISAGFIIVLLGVLLIPSAVAESEQVPYCGDIDGSHAVGSDDLNYFVAYLWLGGPPPPSMLEANFGGCAGVDIHDLVSLVNRFFGNGDPHCEDTAVCVSEIQGAVSLDGVTPMPSPGVLVAGSTVRFGIRLTNSSDQNIVAISNGFRVYSPDGAVWSATIPLLTEEMQEYWYTGFDGGVFACSLNTDGNDADTVAVGGWSLFRAGLSPESELAALTIDIGPIADEAIGKHICIDSCWHRPAGIWAWQQWSFWEPPYSPTWDGPHCYTIAACCEYRGDATLDGGINVSDLTYLVAYLFQGGPGPGCFEAGDVNADTAGPNVSDLTYLVAFLFQGGPEPPGC